MTNKQKGDKVRQNKHLSLEQKQLCYGALMGDSWLRPSSSGQCSFGIGHCKKQKEYLEYKKNKLNQFFVSKKATLTEGELRKDRNNSDFYRYQSVIHQDFTDMYGLFYRGNKKKRIKYITRKLLNKIDIYSLLIWYLDDGSYIDNGNGSKRCGFATNCFSLSEHKAIKIWFWQRFKLDVNILQHTNNTYHLRFNVKNSKRLLEMFKGYINEIPPCMHYKLKS